MGADVRVALQNENCVNHREAFDNDAEYQPKWAHDADSRNRASPNSAFDESRTGSEGRPCCLLVNLAGYGFEKIAPNLGWSCVSADTAEAALDCFQYIRFSFVVINVQGDKVTAAGFRSLVESHSGKDVGLFAVFGSEADAKDEIWARQFGVWIYLSGFPDAKGFQWLCGEALSVGGSVATVAQRHWSTVRAGELRDNVGVQSPSNP